MQKSNQDILISVVAGSLLILVLAGIIIYFLFLYQRKRFQHAQQVVRLTKELTEEALRSRLEMQEQTFNQISQEIHDNVGQILSLTKMQLNIIGQTSLPDNDLLNQAKENLSKGIFGLRDIAKSLSTERIGHFNLEENVGEELERIARTRVIGTHIFKDGHEHPLKFDRKLILFRMIQESLQNVLKHADAKQITLSFKYMENLLCIIIHDDGKGFDVPETLDRNAGLGLQNLLTRAKLTGGLVLIESKPQKGTTIKIEIPYV